MVAKSVLGKVWSHVRASCGCASSVLTLLSAGKCSAEVTTADRFTGPGVGCLVSTILLKSCWSPKRVPSPLLEAGAGVDDDDDDDDDDAAAVCALSAPLLWAASCAKNPRRDIFAALSGLELG